MTPLAALIEFLDGERRPIARQTLLVWIVRHEKVKKDWPRLTVAQWEDVISKATNELLAIESELGIYLPSAEPKKAVKQASLF